MNRREFIKSSAAATAATAFAIPLPAFNERAGWISIDAARNVIEALKANAAEILNGHYVAYKIILHSQVNLVDGGLTPKQRWKAAYHEERMRLRRKFAPAMENGEIGSVSSVRFITSREFCKCP